MILHKEPRSCLIIGAGPAGAACGTLLARQGWQVTVVDRRAGIEQKVCGECLSPPSRGLLERIGAWDQIARTGQWQTLRGITLIGPRGSRCTLDFGTEQPAFTVPRPVLDLALLDSARNAGAKVEWGAAINDLHRAEDGEWRAHARDGREWRAQLLIGADGRHSWVARKTGLASERPHSLQHSAVMSYFSLPRTELNPLDGVEMHVTPWGYAGLNPQEGRVNVIAVLHPDELKRRLHATGERGPQGLLKLLTELCCGESATPALRSRMAGASVLEVQKSYAKWHRQAFGPEEFFCRTLQRLLPHPRLADYVIRQLGRKHALSNVLAEAVADRLPIRRVLSPVFWSRVLWPASG